MGRKWQEYVIEFKANHPKLMEKMFEKEEVVGDESGVVDGDGDEDEDEEDEKNEKVDVAESTSETKNVEVEKSTETEKDKEDVLEQGESEQETSDEEESDEGYNYSDIELSLSDTDEFERLSALGHLREKDITMLLKIRKRENRLNNLKCMQSLNS